jgi:hypothetical protein
LEEGTLHDCERARARNDEFFSEQRKKKVEGDAHTPVFVVVVVVVVAAAAAAAATTSPSLLFQWIFPLQLSNFFSSAAALIRESARRLLSLKGG